MSLLEKATNFEKMATVKPKKYDLSKSLVLANKFDKKFAKIAQSTNIDGARKALVKALVDQWRVDPMKFPMSARETLSPIMYPQKEFSYEELKDVASKLYQNLMNTKDKTTMSFAQNQLMQHIDNLDQLISNKPNIPAPTAPENNQPEETAATDKPVAPAANQFQSIPTDVQAKLNSELAGQIRPLKLDGKLGPLTQKALDLYKAKKNLSALSLAEIIKKIQTA